MTKCGADTLPITEDLTLDFSGLFGSAPPSAQPQEQEAQEEDPKTEKQQALQLLRQSQQAAARKKRSRAVCSEYQANTKQSYALQIEIIKGAKTGENPYTLFLKASKAIALMTANPWFYSQMERDISDIYSKGQNYTPPG